MSTGNDKNSLLEGKFGKTTKGCLRGSPLPPMLSNIVLNELDYELEKRGSICFEP